MHISLSAEAEAFLTEQMAGGLYPDASAVVEAALRHLQAEERWKAYAAAAIDEGLAQSERGTFVSAEEIEDLLGRFIRKTQFKRLRTAMKRYQMTRRAAHDLGEIVRSAARLNPVAAATVARTLLDLFELLGKFPSLGSRRSAITRHPLRLVSIYQCLIVYRPETVLVEILALVPLAGEAARLLSDHFNDEIDETELVLKAAPTHDLDQTITFAQPRQLEIPKP